MLHSIPPSPGSLSVSTREPDWSYPGNGTSRPGNDSSTIRLLGRIDAAAGPVHHAVAGEPPVVPTIGKRRRVGAHPVERQTSRGRLQDVAAALRIAELTRHRRAHRVANRGPQDREA